MPEQEEADLSVTQGSGLSQEQYTAMVSLAARLAQSSGMPFEQLLAIATEELDEEGIQRFQTLAQAIWDAPDRSEVQDV